MRSFGQKAHRWAEFRGHHTEFSLILATQGSDGSAAKPEISSGPRLDVPFAAVKQGVTTRWAWGVFGILFLVHLLESVDRWLLR